MKTAESGRYEKAEKRIKHSIKRRENIKMGSIWRQFNEKSRANEGKNKLIKRQNTGFGKATKQP